jgi:hypothetical protein
LIEASEELLNDGNFMAIKLHEKNVSSEQHVPITRIGLFLFACDHILESMNERSSNQDCNTRADP